MKIISRGNSWEVDVPTRIVKIDNPEKPEYDKRTRVVVRVWLGDDICDCNCRVTEAELINLGEMPEFVPTNDARQDARRYVRRIVIESNTAELSAAINGSVGISEIRLESNDRSDFLYAPVER